MAGALAPFHTSLTRNVCSCLEAAVWAPRADSSSVSGFKQQQQWSEKCKDNVAEMLSSVTVEFGGKPCEYIDSMVGGFKAEKLSTLASDPLTYA